MSPERNVSQQELVNMTSRLNLSLNVPECDDFLSLVKYTYLDFCLAIDCINQGVYISRAKTEGAYADLLARLYSAWNEDKHHEGPFVLNRAVYGMAGGTESDLEKYWNLKAQQCSMPLEKADHSMLKELVTTLLRNTSSSSISIPDIPEIGDDFEDYPGVPKAARKLLLAKKTHLSDADLEVEFNALRKMSTANVNESSIASGGLKIYDDVNDDKQDHSDFETEK